MNTPCPDRGCAQSRTCLHCHGIAIKIARRKGRHATAGTSQVPKGQLRGWTEQWNSRRGTHLLLMASALAHVTPGDSRPSCRLRFLPASSECN